MKKIIVESSEPIRLDRYIKRIFPTVTQGVIERYLRNGKIKVNKTKVKFDFTQSTERGERRDGWILFN